MKLSNKLRIRYINTFSNTKYAIYAWTSEFVQFTRPRKSNRTDFLSKTRGFYPAVIWENILSIHPIKNTTTEVLPSYIIFDLNRNWFEVWKEIYLRFYKILIWGYNRYLFEISAGIDLIFHQILIWGCRIYWIEVSADIDFWFKII